MINRQELDRLFGIEEAMRGMGLQGMSSDEIRAVVQGRKSQGMGGGIGRSPMAPMPMSMSSQLNGGQFQSQVPIAGFQGNTMFNNQAGVGQINTPMGMGESRNMDMMQNLNPAGQLRQDFNSPQGRFALAQGGGMPGQMGGGMGTRGFTTNIQIGEDGQISQINLKRAIQKARMQQQGQMGGMA